MRKRQLFFLFALFCLFFCSSTAIGKSDRNSETSKLSAEQIKKAKLEIEAALCTQWTRERIKRYCWPATRSLPSEQAPSPMTDTFITGRLYRNTTPKLGKVIWDCCLDENAKPLDLEIVVVKSGKHRGDAHSWVIGGLSLEPKFSEGVFDSELDKFIVNKLLRNAVEAYQYVHCFENDLPKDFRGLHANSEVNVTYNQSGKATGFAARLAQGQMLTADLTPAMLMTNVLVDGIPDHYWTAIAAELNQNVDKNIARTSENEIRKKRMSN